MEPVCSITSLSTICSRPAGSFRKYDFPSGNRSDLFEIRAVHVLAQADGGDGHVLRGRFLGQIETVAFFGDAVGEQHDVLERGVRGQHFAIRLRQRGRDLRAAIRDDSRDQALDQDLVFGAANRHVPLKRVVEDQHADQIDGAKILHHADRGLPRQLDLLAFHGRRFVDDQ